MFSIQETFFVLDRERPISSSELLQADSRLVGYNKEQLNTDCVYLWDTQRIGLLDTEGTYLLSTGWMWRLINAQSAIYLLVYIHVVWRMWHGIKLFQCSNMREQLSDNIFNVTIVYSGIYLWYIIS